MNLLRPLFLLSMVSCIVSFSGGTLNPGECSTKGKIIIGACEWEPYTGENIYRKGLLSAICVEAFKRAGYDSEIVIYPWARAVVEAKEGKIHALLGASYSSERERYFAFPDEVWRSGVGFFKAEEKGDNSRFISVRALAPATVGVLSGSVYADNLKTVAGIKIETATAVDLNIKKLAFGRIDYLIEDKIAVNYIIRHRMPELRGKIVFINPPYIYERLYMVVSKNAERYKEIVSDFNRGLAGIKKDGTFDKIVKKYKAVYGS